MVLPPDGERLPVDTFFRFHGSALVAVVIKAPIPATVTSTVGAAYWSSDIAKWIAKVTAANERVKILTVREITGRGL